VLSVRTERDLVIVRVVAASELALHDLPEHQQLSRGEALLDHGWAPRAAVLALQPTRAGGQ
jgi:hypothetical protein